MRSSLRQAVIETRFDLLKNVYLTCLACPAVLVARRVIYVASLPLETVDFESIRSRSRASDVTFLDCSR